MTVPGPFPSREGSRRGGGSAGMGGSGAVSPQGAPNKRLLLLMGPGTVGQEHDPGRSPEPQVRAEKTPLWSQSRGLRMRHLGWEQSSG